LTDSSSARLPETAPEPEPAHVSAAALAGSESASAAASAAGVGSGAPGQATPSVARALWRRFIALEWLPPFGRASALFILIGASLGLLLQTSVQARWVTDFVLTNQLGPEKRKVLLLTIGLGAGLGLLASIGYALWLGARRRPFERLERAAWFLSPLIIAGTLPMLFRHATWKGRALDLLLSSVMVVFIAEGTVRRSFGSVPSALVDVASFVRLRLPRWVRTHAATVTVWLAALGYSLFMTTYTIVRHRKLQSAVFDLGISDNLMYNALAGEFMEAPVFSGAAAELDFLANHFQIGQYVFLPIYALHPSAETLLGIQSFALGLSAIPLYAFARRRLSSWAAALVALAFLAYYPMHGANFYEMTYLPVACPFILGTLWALDAGRYKTLIPIFAAALLMREDISFGLAIAATVFVLANHRRRAAFVVALVSTVYFGLVRFWIMPAMGTWCFPDLMYKELIPAGAPSTFGSVIKTLVTNPAYTFSKIATQDKLVFVLHLLVPVAFLPLRRAWLWAALAPGIITTLLTTAYKPTVSLGFHYTMQWTPFIWLAVPVALALIARSASDGLPRMRAAIVAMLLATGILSYHFGAFGRHPDFLAGFSAFDFKYEAEHKQRYADLKFLVDQLPRDASVSVSEHAGAHASNRVRAYSMRAGPQGADFVLAGKFDLGVADTRSSLVKALNSNEYGVWQRRGEFAIFKRGHDTSGNAELRRDWGL
jgi:uncharacterized membrane protein